MNAVQNFLATYPFAQTALEILALTVPPAFFLAFAGLGLFGAAAQSKGARQRRKSFSKCARQLSMLGMVLGWGLLIGMRIWLYLAPIQQLSMVFEASWLLLAVATLLASSCFLGAKLLEKAPWLHALLGILQAVLAYAAFLLGLASAHLAPLVDSVLEALRTGRVPEIPPLQDILLPLATPISYSLLLLLALPAAFGAFWLVLRRKHDDYGRDHYNVTLPWCAAWARNAWLALWLLMLAFNGLNVYDRWQNGVFTSYDALLQSIPLLLWLIPPLLWAVVSSSKTPLRHKFSLALALLLSIAYLLPFTLEVATPIMPDAVLWEWPLQDLAPETLQENPLPEPELPQQELPAPDVPEGDAPEAGQPAAADTQPAAPQQEKP